MAWAQQLLAGGGYTVPVSGYYQGSTQAAVIAFQRDHGLSQTGNLDVPTWGPLLLLVRVLSESGITPEERVQLLRRAVAADANLVGAHRALAMEEIPNAERTEEIQRVATLEPAQPAGAFGAMDASIFDRWPSQPRETES